MCDRPKLEDSLEKWNIYFKKTRIEKTVEDKALLNKKRRDSDRIRRKRHRANRKASGDLNHNRTTQQLNRIYERDRGICFWCYKHVERVDASREHIVPLSKGGAGDDSNVALAHRRCNK